MLEKQYRIYPISIYNNESIYWQIQYRIHPFWWSGLLIDGGFVFKNTREECVEALNLFLNKKSELKELQEKNKGPL